MADKLTRGDVVRRFYALFLESSVASDGQVKGFAKWYDTSTRYARQKAEAMAEAAWRKINGGHPDPDEVIILAVQGLRLALEYAPPIQETRSSPEYAAFRFDLIRMIQDQNLRPLEVAAILEQRRAEFPEIETWEIENLRDAREDWKRAHAGTMARWRNSA